MHEIITLQLGQRSNYVATHFWNAQESYFTYEQSGASPIDHDVLFRPGIGADGRETFTPRTVVYDLKGGFGSLRKINALYESQEEPGMPQGLWDGPTVIRKQPLIPENQYQADLEDGSLSSALTTGTVKYWSDFNRVFYHPRSIVQLNEYELSSSLMPFENWDAGQELFGSLDKEHDLLDRDLRPFAEECDQLQGMQIISGVSDAWGGFAARYVERLRDEYGKSAIWVWALEDSVKSQRKQQRLKSINVARSTYEISTQASIYVPIADPPTTLPPDVILDRSSSWHNSALLSSAVETVTIPSRLKASQGLRMTLHDLELALNVNGDQRIASLQFSRRISGVHRSVGESIGGDTSSGSAIDACLATFDMNLSPLTECDDRSRQPNKAHTFGQVEVTRDDRMQSAASVVEEAAREERRGSASSPVVRRARTSLLYPLLDSFPDIFTHPSQTKRPKAIPTQAALGTTSAVAERIKAMRRAVSRMVGVEDRETLTNGLGEIAETYQEGWDAGSDEDDD